MNLPVGQAMDLSAAIDYFTQVLAGNANDAEALGNRGTARRLQGHYADAIIDLDAALKLAPTHAGFLSSKGAALTSLRRPTMRWRVLMRP